MAYAVAETPSGDVVLGGSADRGWCVREWVGELGPHGAVKTSFGSGGRTQVPALEDSEVARVAVEPGGDILALTVGGNMGIWSVRVAALTPSGSRVPSFEQNFGAATLGAVFIGNLVVHGDGFLLVGTGQGRPVTSVPARAQRAVLLLSSQTGTCKGVLATAGKPAFLVDGTAGLGPA
jgi:hypothetical protein